MNAVGADQDIAARGFDMGAGAVEEMRDHAALVLRERAEPATGVDGLRAEPFLDGAMDDALQAAAMDRELRHVVTGIEAARLAPDFLAVTVEIIQLIGADRGGVEPVQQAEAGQFADRMRQRVDADAEFADAVGLFEQFAVDAAGPQHQRGGEASDAASDDDRLHPRYSTLLYLRPRRA